MAYTKERQSLAFLDGLRGIAAIYVMVGHARWLLWEGYAEGFKQHPQEYGIVAKVFVYFFSLFKWGHAGAIFFFVLSGFVIHLKYSKQIASNYQGGFDWLDYMFRRTKRIYPPFLFAILLTFILDNIGMHYGFSIYSKSTPYIPINESVTTNLSFTSFLHNILFLGSMHIEIPAFGTNGALWTIAYEWWYYLYYTILFFLNRLNMYLSMVVVCVISFIGFYFYIPELDWTNRTLGSLPIWYLGVILADTYTKRININTAWYGLLIPFGFIAFAKDLIYPDYGLGASFLGIIGVLLFANKKWPSVTNAIAKLKVLGDFSFSLYVVHLPIFILLSGYLMSKSPTGVLPQNQIYIFIGIGISMLVAYGAHFLVEKPFIRK